MICRREEHLPHQPRSPSIGYSLLDYPDRRCGGEGIFPYHLPAKPCCVPNAISFLIPSSVGDIRERICGKTGPFRLRDFPAQIYFGRVYEIAHVEAGGYLILRESHVPGLSVTFAPLRCAISDTSSREVFSIPYSVLAAKLFRGWLKLGDDYLVLRTSTMPPGSPESTVEEVGSIADTAISFMRKNPRGRAAESPTNRITLAPNRPSGGGSPASSAPPVGSIADTAISVMGKNEMCGREEEAEIDRITLAPRRPSGAIFTRRKTIGPCLKTLVPNRSPDS